MVFAAQKKPIFYKRSKAMKNGLFKTLWSKMSRGKTVTVNHFKSESVSEGDAVYLMVFSGWYELWVTYTKSDVEFRSSVELIEFRETVELIEFGSTFELIKFKPTVFFLSGYAY